MSETETPAPEPAAGSAPPPWPSSSDPSGEDQSFGAQGVGGDSLAEPAADVAHLLSEADRLVTEYEAKLAAELPVQHPGTIARDGVSCLIRQLAAALTAQAERIAELEAFYGISKAAVDAALARANAAEALLREAGELLDCFGICADDWDEMGDNRIVNLQRHGKGDQPIYVSELRAARALADKIRGCGDG